MQEKMIQQSLLDSVLEKAKNATQGDWRWSQESGVFATAGDYATPIASEVKHDDAEYIASVNPQFVQALIEEHAKMRTIIEFYADINHWVESSENSYCRISGDGGFENINGKKYDTLIGGKRSREFLNAKYKTP